MFSNKSDNKAILKKQTLKKVWNISQLYASFLLSRLLKTPVTWGKPSSISIEPTTACNLGCPECPSGLKQFTRATGNLKFDLNKKIIDELGSYLSFINYAITVSIRCGFVVCNKIRAAITIKILIVGFFKIRTCIKLI